MSTGLSPRPIILRQAAYALLLYLYGIFFGIIGALVLQWTIDVV